MMKVQYIDHMGSDLSVVNAALVSFDKESKWERVGGPAGGYSNKLSDADTRLIQFLARGMTAADFEEFVEDVADTGYLIVDEDDPNHGYGRLIDLLWEWRRNPTHWAPFAHPHASFRIKAPIFVARQLAKHQIGMTWSEVSRRYIESEPEFYVPEFLRAKAANVKQGSSDEAVDVEPYNLTGFQLTEVGPVKFSIPMDDTVFNQLCLDYYNHKLDAGVCPEQARMVLPQSTMTEWIWTGSLYAWANVYNQRTNAQKETQEIARQIGYHMAQYFPVSWGTLT